MAESERTVRVRMIISGQVQGVSFRAGAQAEAMRLGIVGFARNNGDGSVLIEAEGSPFAVGQFRRWCAAGPPRANVEHIAMYPITLAGGKDFIAG